MKAILTEVGKINGSGYRIKEEGSQRHALRSIEAIQGECLFKFSDNLHPLASLHHFSFSIPFQSIFIEFLMCILP